MARLPKLPRLLAGKIYKTGQTRGADDDQVFQNRVGRNSTVLIPFGVWQAHSNIRVKAYENGYIVLISPTEYFDKYGQDISVFGLEVGVNALVYYEKREDWLMHLPENYGYREPNSRTSPLNGQYAARIANTTADSDKRINRGYTNSGLKGAGIRLYEYADTKALDETRLQLEAAFWHTVDANEKMLSAGMLQEDIDCRSKAILDRSKELGLLSYDDLIGARILNAAKELVCPLCLEPISAAGMLSRLPQASGRERHDLTVTEINLFHIKELAFGEFNHKPYNLGWGHHHCNVVCKDVGISHTLDWMKEVLGRNAIVLTE
ncbi:BstXI family restriction endonuclease [Sulfitobacter sp. MF3-043]|uniref:BstXI family restriction endonuclease n=1 Tax=Sulfitobacter sediminivivens TaxID=3252902 RepID=UPI0036D7F63B